MFNQILDSSISEDFTIRHVFIDLLILADEKGIVDMTVSAIARRINAPVEVVASSILRLMQPDSSSRSTEEGGRRLILLDPPREWGWIIVNYRKYRSIRSAEDRREYQSEYHKRRKSAVVNPPQPVATESTNAYASASAYASEGKESEKTQAETIGKNGMLDPAFSENEPGYWAERLYARHPKKKHLPLAQALISEMWCARGAEALDFFRKVDVVHVLWCETPDWKKKNGNFAPKLDEWLADRGWQQRPDSENPYRDPYGSASDAD